MNDSVIPRLAYTYADAAVATGVSIDVIRRAVRVGDLIPSYPTSRPVLMVEELTEWLRSRPNESPKEAGG